MLAGKSFIITRNSMGEIIEPCGVPFFSVCVPDNVFPTLTCMVRLDKKVCNISEHFTVYSHVFKFTE